MRTDQAGQSALLFLDVVEILQREKVGYALIGAFALSMHGCDGRGRSPLHNPAALGNTAHGI